LRLTNAKPTHKILSPHYLTGQSKDSYLFVFS
jgi:hypothetical protein